MAISFQTKHGPAWYQQAVRALLEAGGEDGRQLGKFSQVSQCEYVVIELVGREILYQEIRPVWWSTSTTMASASLEAMLSSTL